MQPRINRHSVSKSVGLTNQNYLVCRTLVVRIPIFSLKEQFNSTFIKWITLCSTVTISNGFMYVHQSRKHPNCALHLDFKRHQKPRESFSSRLWDNISHLLNRALFHIRSQSITLPHKSSRTATKVDFNQQAYSTKVARQRLGP